MAAGWVKSLQCKSRAFEDVYHPNPKQLLLQTASCRNSYQNLKDVANPNKPPKPKPKPTKPDPDCTPKRTTHHSHKLRHASFHRRSESTKPEPKPDPESLSRVRRTLSAPIKGPSATVDFPSLSELPVGHPSRNVVEIIFHTRWGPKGFSGRVEMVFKIHSPARTSARFEEYRSHVRSSARAAARCSADGNEMMRFRCLGPTVGPTGSIDVGECGTTINGGKSATSADSICTYSGSGAAHESVGGGKGRRAMLVCRVIAGRVGSTDGVFEFDSGRVGSMEFDSVSGEGGELLVFDSRAVLPCFLVIYKL